MKLWLVFATVFLALGPVTEVSAQRLHAILAADTDTGPPVISRSVTANNRMLRQLLTNGLGTRVSIIELTGGQMTANNITQTLRRLQINRNDTVLFYYSGHGGYDRSQGHFFALHHGRDLRRSEVINAITNPFTPRFWAVISDCCASISRVAACPALAPGGNDTLLTNLFLDTTGRVDITSSRPEQVSVGTDGGGVFTGAFCAVMQNNANRRLNWNEVFPLLREAAGEFGEPAVQNLNDPFYYRGIKQETQTAYSFRAMYGREVNGLRLGIHHENRVISRVTPGLPGAQAGLRRGMRVVSVNGKNVGSDSQLITAVNFSPRNAVIETGDGRRFNVRLAY